MQEAGELYDLCEAMEAFAVEKATARLTQAALEPLRQQMEARGWQDERLKVMVLQAVALHAHGEKDKAVQVLGDALS